MDHIKIKISDVKQTLASYPSYKPEYYPTLCQLTDTPNTYVLYMGSSYYTYLVSPSEMLANTSKDEISANSENITNMTLLKALAIAQDPKLALELCK